jgi:hypothetical protein
MHGFCSLVQKNDIMNDLMTKNHFSLLSSVVPIAAAAITKIGIDKSYEAITGNHPPKNPEADNVSLGNMILYTALTAAAAVTVNIIMRQVLTNQWRKRDGELPEQLK